MVKFHYLLYTDDLVKIQGIRIALGTKQDR